MKIIVTLYDLVPRPSSGYLVENVRADSQDLTNGMNPFVDEICKTL